MASIRRPVPYRALLLGLALACTPFLASCGGEKGDPFTPSLPATGGLTVTVVVEDGGVAGVQIQIDGPETRTGTTNSSGVAVFSQIAPGDYTVEITSAPASLEFTRTSRTVSVPAGGTASVSFLGTVKTGS